MKSPMRFAAAALAAMTLVGVLTSSAGADTTSWNAKASAGALDVTLLGQKLELAGGVTEADANSNALAEAIGTGLCISSGTPGPCPTDLTSPTGQSLDTTQKAVQQGDGTTAKGPVCAGTVPAAPLATIGVGCGNATATEASNSPTAEGDGSILDAAALNITMGNALNAMGIALPSAANAPCAGTTAPAASSSPGTGSSTLPAPAASLLGTANTIISGLKLPTLDPTTVSQNSPQDSTCSILGGLANQLSGVPVLGALVGGLVNGTSLNGVMGTSLLDVTAVEAKSSVTTSTVNGDTVETAYSRGDTLGVNILGGMLDIKVVPAVATATVDRTTGKASSNCTPGLVQVTVNNGTPNIVSLQPLGDALNQLLDQLEASALKPLLDALLQVPAPGILNCTSPVNSADGTSSSVTGGIFNATLIPAAGMPGGLLTLKVNDVTASASSTSAESPQVTTNPSTQQPPAAKPASNPVVPAAAPAEVPNVTSVHTGEFWAGTLPIILMAGMALAGSLLIGRRRVMSFARNLPVISRRWGGH